MLDGRMVVYGTINASDRTPSVVSLQNDLVKDAKKENDVSSL